MYAVNTMQYDVSTGEIETKEINGKLLGGRGKISQPMLKNRSTIVDYSRPEVPIRRLCHFRSTRGASIHRPFPYLTPTWCTYLMPAVLATLMWYVIIMIIIFACAGGLAHCVLHLQLYRHMPGLDPRCGRIICIRISNAHALRLISRTGKRVWRCPLSSVTVGGI